MSTLTMRHTHHMSGVEKMAILLAVFGFFLMGTIGIESYQFYQNEKQQQIVVPPKSDSIYDRLYSPKAIEDNSTDPIWPVAITLI